MGPHPHPPPHTIPIFITLTPKSRHREEHLFPLFPTLLPQVLLNQGREELLLSLLFLSFFLSASVIFSLWFLNSTTLLVSYCLPLSFQVLQTPPYFSGGSSKIWRVLLTSEFSLLYLPCWWIWAVPKFNLFSSRSDFFLMGLQVEIMLLNLPSNNLYAPVWLYLYTCLMLAFVKLPGVLLQLTGLTPVSTFWWSSILFRVFWVSVFSTDTIFYFFLKVEINTI